MKMPQLKGQTQASNHTETNAYLFFSLYDDELNKNKSLIKTKINQVQTLACDNVSESKSELRKYLKVEVVVKFFHPWIK